MAVSWIPAVSAKFLFMQYTINIFFRIIRIIFCASRYLRRLTHYRFNITFTENIIGFSYFYVLHFFSISVVAAKLRIKLSFLFSKIKSSMTANYSNYKSKWCLLHVGLLCLYFYDFTAWVWRPELERTCKHDCKHNLIRNIMPLYPAKLVGRVLSS